MKKALKGGHCGRCRVRPAAQAEREVIVFEAGGKKASDILTECFSPTA